MDGTQKQGGGHLLPSLLLLLHPHEQFSLLLSFKDKSGKGITLFDSERSSRALSVDFQASCRHYPSATKGEKMLVAYRSYEGIGFSLNGSVPFFTITWVTEKLLS